MLKKCQLCGYTLLRRQPDQVARLVHGFGLRRDAIWRAKNDHSRPRSITRCVNIVAMRTRSNELAIPFPCMQWTGIHAIVI